MEHGFRQCRTAGAWRDGHLRAQPRGRRALRSLTQPVSTRCLRLRGRVAMSTAYLGLGSNLDAERHLQAGVTALRERFGTVRLSPVYRSMAVGFSGHDFINLAASIETTVQPLELKTFLNQLEAHHGRTREVPRFSDRTLDIDILLWDDLYLRLPTLTLPRGEILECAHVLKPLADLAPDLVHPVAKVTIAELWANFAGDKSVLTPVDYSF
jgi:2-amino-4-hydroxy-6-hydroxymethyldihydropteridine diphosphokinase